MSVDHYPERLVLEDEQFGEFSQDSLADDEDEAVSIRAALAESFAQVERGETVSLEEFKRRMHEEHGIPH